MRRRCLLAGSTAATAAGLLWMPMVGAAIGMAAATVIVGQAMRPSSDFYLRSSRRAPRSVRGVALTFDDGPDPVRTPEVLAALAEFDAKATFFMIGRRVDAAPDLVKRVLAAGHEIGAHSHSHDRSLPLRTTARHRHEVAASIQSLVDAGAPRPRWYRPPMGFSTPPLATALAEHRLESATWSLHAHDRTERSEPRLVASLLQRVQPGDVILLHDGCDRHGPGPAILPAVLRRVLRALRERGLTPMTLSELFAAERRS